MPMELCRYLGVILKLFFFTVCLIGVVLNCYEADNLLLAVEDDDEDDDEDDVCEMQ